MAKSAVRPTVVECPDKATGLLSDVRALHGIIDAVPHPIFVKDASSRFVIVNRAFCK
jgi:PAS domain-containing protein